MCFFFGDLISVAFPVVGAVVDVVFVVVGIAIVIAVVVNKVGGVGIVNHSFVVLVLISL